MSDHDQPPGDVHAAVLLLPWYLSERLVDAERRQVERHLSGCAACRAEIETLAQLRADVRQTLDAAAGPSARVRQVVMEHVRAHAARRGWLDRLAHGTRGVLEPKWAPSVALLLIVGQLGVLTWLAARPGPNAPPSAAAAPSGLSTRSVQSAPARVRIVFNPEASLRDVEGVIRQLGGHIVNGPDAEDGYVIELPALAPKELAARLHAASARRDIVERVENAAP